MEYVEWRCWKEESVAQQSRRQVLVTDLTGIYDHLRTAQQRCGCARDMKQWGWKYYSPHAKCLNLNTLHVPTRNPHYAYLGMHTVLFIIRASLHEAVFDIFIMKSPS